MGAIGGANMWALLLDKDPGHNATAGDLAVDIVDGKLKNAAAVTTVKVHDAPQTGNAPKRGKGGTAAVVEVAKLVKRGNMVKKEKKKGADGDDKQAPATVNGGQVQMNGTGYSKQAVAGATVVEKLTSTGREEIKDRQAALPKEEVFEVVTGRGGRRRTVDTQTQKAAVPVAVITGTNMWAVLSDDDPGHGRAAAMPTKRGKKTREEKKKNAAKLEEETPASELEEEMGEEEEEMTGGEAATVGSRCRTVAAVGMFWAALAVAMLILFFDATA